MKHLNSGYCPQCQDIINRYSMFHVELRAWFENFQRNHPEAHTSCAGRGKLDQEALFLRKASRARWGQSAHNYNAALDLFCQKKGKDIYDKDWFRSVLSPEISGWITWYGKPGSPFYELPHIQVKEWRKMNLSLVEFDD